MSNFALKSLSIWQLLRSEERIEMSTEVHRSTQWSWRKTTAILSVNEQEKSCECRKSLFLRNGRSSRSTWLKGDRLKWSFLSLLTVWPDKTIALFWQIMMSRTWSSECHSFATPERRRTLTLVVIQESHWYLSLSSCKPYQPWHEVQTVSAKMRCSCSVVRRLTSLLDKISIDVLC